MAKTDFSVLLAVCAWREIKIYTLESLLNLQNCPNPKICYKIQMGDALISRSRSQVATFFLKSTDYDVLFFLDDDIRINTMDATSIMWLAWQHKCDVVGAVYPTKSQYNSGMVMTPVEFGKTVAFGKEGGMLEVRHIGNGCMAIRREVLKAMVDSGNVPFCKHDGKDYYPFFEHYREFLIDGYKVGLKEKLREWISRGCSIEEVLILAEALSEKYDGRSMIRKDILPIIDEIYKNGQWQDLSEDYWFAEEARKLGFKIWVDTRIKLYHEGSYLYSWDDVVECGKKTRKTYESPVLHIADRNKQISSSFNGERPVEEPVTAAKGDHNAG